MRRRIVSIILAITVMVLILPGCASNAEGNRLLDHQAAVSKLEVQITDLEAQITELASKVSELTSQITDLNATIEAKNTKIAEQVAQISVLETQIVTLNSTLKSEDENAAKLEVSIIPNPVVCIGHWQWRVVVAETNGVCVNLVSVNVTYLLIRGGTGEVRNYTAAQIFQQKGKSLPAYGKITGRFGISCASPVSGAEFIVTGVDEYGNEVEGSAQADFVK